MRMLARVGVLLSLMFLPDLGGCQRTAMAPDTVRRLEAAAGLQSQRTWTPKQAELALGIRLFFDPRLSRTNKVSCGSCHNPKLAFTDGRPVGVGVDGRLGGRSTPTVLGAKHSPVQFWDGRATSLEEQALGPIANPVEMDMPLGTLVPKLSAIPMYPPIFQQAYGTGVTEIGVARAIAAFERALESEPSPYDRWQDGDDAAMSPAAVRGQALFSRNHCGDCHKGTNLTDNKFHNTGWGMDQPQPDLGRFNVTRVAEDTGAFKTPTLRNVAETAPYMHDGRLETLEAVIDFYNEGGRPNPYLSEKMHVLNLSTEEKADLVAFMKAHSSGNNFKALAKEAVARGQLALP